MTMSAHVAPPTPIDPPSPPLAQPVVVWHESQTGSQLPSPLRGFPPLSDQELAQLALLSSSESSSSPNPFLKDDDSDDCGDDTDVDDDLDLHYRAFKDLGRKMKNFPKRLPDDPQRCKSSKCQFCRYRDVFFRGLGLDDGPEVIESSPSPARATRRPGPYTRAGG